MESERGVCVERGREGRMGFRRERVVCGRWGVGECLMGRDRARGRPSMRRNKKQKSTCTHSDINPSIQLNKLLFQTPRNNPIRKPRILSHPPYIHNLTETPREKRKNI